MKICDDGHEEIVYSGRDCPACALVGRQVQLDGKVEELEAALEEKEIEVDNLGEKIDQLEEEAKEAKRG